MMLTEVRALIKSAGVQAEEIKLTRTSTLAVKAKGKLNIDVTLAVHLIEGLGKLPAGIVMYFDSAEILVAIGNYEDDRKI